MKKLFVFSFVVLISSPILAQGGPGGGGGGPGGGGGGAGGGTFVPCSGKDFWNFIYAFQAPKTGGLSTAGIWTATPMPSTEVGKMSLELSRPTVGNPSWTDFDLVLAMTPEASGYLNVAAAPAPVNPVDALAVLYSGELGTGPDPTVAQSLHDQSYLDKPENHIGIEMRIEKCAALKVLWTRPGYLNTYKYHVRTRVALSNPCT